MKTEELEKIARQYVCQNPPPHYDPAIQADMMEYDITKVFLPFLRWLTNSHFIVTKEFVEKQRLIIEYDKKVMLEKPTGEKTALAGVYQAKLELMDKLFNGTEQ